MTWCFEENGEVGEQVCLLDMRGNHGRKKKGGKKAPVVKRKIIRGDMGDKTRKEKNCDIHGDRGVGGGSRGHPTCKPMLGA